MNSPIIIHLKNGHTIEGRLARTFGENDVDVEIFVEQEERKLLFALEEVCAIRFAKLPPWVPSDESATIEEVQTITGETFKVAIFPRMRFLKGFFGIAKDETATYRTIFFTNTGVRHRSELRRIGEILKDKGLVTDNHLKEALKTQNELRNRLMKEVIVESTGLSREEIEKTLQKASEKREVPSNARVGDILVEAGLLTREQVEKAYETQQAGKKVRLGELLIAQGFITEEQLLSALATKFRLRFVNLQNVIPSEEALGILSEGLVDRLQVFPVELDGHKLVVATSTPTDPTVGDSLRFCTNLNIELVVAPARQIAVAIDKYYHHRKDSIDTLLESMKDEAQSVAVEEEVEETQTVETDSEVIALINRLLIDAYKRGASDIHLEPSFGKNPVLVRYRIDGECVVAHKIAATFKNAIISRVKIISGLDISERRRPQSGKILLRFEQAKLEYRVEITPTVGGQENAVLRLLSAARPLPLGEMGLMPYNFERFKGLLEKPHGMILCVGPTGSGKTTTLHSALGHINKPMRKIWTAEDPVEITQPGLCQVQVNSKIGYTFSEALRSFLRADPDVIMIGEMRDSETAKIAIEASLTGHLVFSTLHTNSAPETVVRLIDMGMDPFNFADALLGVVAQRLVRKLCDYCKKGVRPKREVYDEYIADFVRDAGRASELLPSYEESVVMMRNGCEKCGGNGYKGRIAIHELLVGTPPVKNAIRRKLGVEELRKTALADGMWALRMDGIMKVFNGFTDMEQIHRVCM